MPCTAKLFILIVHIEVPGKLLVVRDPEIHNVITRTTSDPLNILRKHSNNEVRKNFFSNRVVEKWNSLPAEVKRVKKVSTFKSSVGDLIKKKLI